MNDGATLPLFPADSPANRSAQPGSAEAQAMTATSGRRCYELFVSYPRHTSWAKTFLDCFLSTGGWYSRLCALTWSVQDTTYSRSIIRLRASVPRTDEIECSLLPTPVTPSGGGERSGDRAGTGTLDYMARSGMLATPTAKANQLAPSMQKWPSCQAMWPTPRSADGEKGTRTPEGHAKERERRQNGHDLPTAVAVTMWPTPAAQDGKNGTLPPSQCDRDQHGQLNPDWVEWLQGFPIGWTENPTSQESQPESKTEPHDCEHSETQ